MKIALIGSGTVGRGLLELIHNKSSFLSEKYDFKPSVVAISDPKVGSVYNEDGLNLSRILKLLDEKGTIKDYSDGISGWDSEKTIKETNCDTVAEVTPTNLEDGNPGLEFIRTALSMGKNVATTNKGPITLAYRELEKLADKNNCFLKFEGTVLAGTPAINLAQNALAGAEITEIKGIVNGTTNYILTRMESGMPYKDALKEAQEKGYAEAVPDADVEGWDATAKVVIMSNVLMGGDIKVSDVDREGITSISIKDVENALNEGKHWKLIAHAVRKGKSISASVKPIKVDEDDPLSAITGATNAITFTTDSLNDVTISGPGAGKIETGFALLNDLIYISKHY